jgi:hypothetical protein
LMLKRHFSSKVFNFAKSLSTAWHLPQTLDLTCPTAVQREN